MLDGCSGEAELKIGLVFPGIVEKTDLRSDLVHRIARRKESGRQSGHVLQMFGKRLSFRVERAGTVCQKWFLRRRLRSVRKMRRIRVHHSNLQSSYGLFCLSA